MSHFYNPITAEPCHFVAKKDGNGNRPSHVGDARKNGWVPGPSTVLGVLNKPALTTWLVRQGVYAVVTAPDVAGESLDDKLTRILDVECQQDEESAIARDRGTDIHAAIELHLNGQQFDPALTPYVAPVVDAVNKLGRVVATEKILVGNGYAGKTDCILENEEAIIVVDFKTAKNLPTKGAWPEHRMQAAAYTEAVSSGCKRKFYVIIYISTTEQGKIAVFDHHDWQQDFQKFDLILRYWYLANNMEFPELEHFRTPPPNIDIVKMTEQILGVKP